MMSTTKRNALRMASRRTFLAGAGGIAIGLPFLESVPDRSAWAQSENPRFAFFIGTACGVVQDNFWPVEVGQLTDLSSDTNAAGALAGLERWITFVQGTSYPGTSNGSSHARGGVSMYTGGPTDGAGGHTAVAVGPSIDVVLAPYLNPDAAAPLTLYSGLKSGWIDERLSFDVDGQIRPAEGNPFEVYEALLGQVPADGGAASTDVNLSELLVRRKSAIDLVRDDLQELLGRSGIGQADRERMELHLSSLREIETELTDAPVVGTCSESSLDVDAIVASAEIFRSNGYIEQVAELQMQLAAFAFACNIQHVATLQIGDGEDGTVYDVPSNDRGWRFHHISHRIQSDSATGDDPLALQAHIEIDRLRLETFRRGLVKFQEHGLLDRSVVMWTNSIADGPSGSGNNLPSIVVGNAGGTFRTGLHYQPSQGGIPNSRLLTTLAFALGVNETVGVDGELMTDLLV